MMWCKKWKGNFNCGSLEVSRRMVPVNLLKLISYDLLLLYVVCPVKVNNTIVVYVM